MPIGVDPMADAGRATATPDTPFPAGRRTWYCCGPMATCAEEAGSTPAFADRCFIASNAKRAPRCGVLAAGVDPPNCLGKWPLADCAAPRPSLSGVPPERGHASFRALLRDTRQKGTNFGLPVTAVTTERPDRRELSGLCPSGNCLRVNPEHCRDFRWRKQRLSLWCTC